MQLVLRGHLPQSLAELVLLFIITFLVLVVFPSLRGMEREKNIGQLQRVFEESFNAKPVYNQNFFMQKFNCIHHNPVSGKWKLENDYTAYEHSSASFYKPGIVRAYKQFDFRVI